MSEPSHHASSSAFADPNPLEAPLGVGDILDGAFRLYRAHFGPMLLSAAVVMAPLGIMSAQLLGPTQAAQLSVFQALLGQRDTSLLGDGPALPVLALCLLMPLQVVGTLVVRLVLTQQSIDALRGRTRSVGERYRNALTRLPSYAAMGCLTWLLIGIAVVGLGLMGLLVFGGMAAAAAALGSGSGAAVLAGVLFGTAIIAGAAVMGGTALYLAGRWIAALPVLVLVTPDPIAALGTSWQLTARRPWRAMAFMALLFLLQYVLTTILTTPLYVVGVLLPPATAAALGILIQALGAVVAILVLPLWSAALVVFHYDLRLRDERAL